MSPQTKRERVLPGASIKSKLEGFNGDKINPNEAEQKIKLIDTLWSKLQNEFPIISDEKGGSVHQYQFRETLKRINEKFQYGNDLVAALDLYIEQYRFEISRRQAQNISTDSMILKGNLMTFILIRNLFTSELEKRK